MYILWYRRNFVLHDSNTWNASCILDKAKKLLANFYEATKVPPLTFISKWEVPNGNCFKINFDAAVSVGFKFFGLELLLELVKRIFFAGFSKKCKGCPVVFVAELTVACEALKFAIEVGFRGELVLEGDNLSVVNALISEDKVLAVGGIIVENILRLRQAPQSLEFSFVKRSGNTVSHVFAKFSFYIPDIVIWG